MCGAAIALIATRSFGLWRRDWLRQHFSEYQAFPYWGADVLWLADICLSAPVVGNQQAVIFKCRRASAYAPRSARERNCRDDRIRGSVDDVDVVRTFVADEDKCTALTERRS